MASHQLKIHQRCNVSPSPPPTHHVPLPLTFFDLFWLRIHPIERIFFYPLHSPPSSFFHKVVPNLKTSLSFTLHHFLPLAGNIVWPSHAHKPVVQYNHGDGVSLVIAESDADFDAICDVNSFREASESRSFVPHLDSSNSHASVLSLQITLFPNRGFCIGISTHHAVLDGKSSTLFLKAWASLCQRIGGEEESTPTLAPELEPFLNREVIKDPKEYGLSIPVNQTEILPKMFPNENDDGRCLKILPSEPKVEDHVRAVFELTRADLEKLKNKVLSKWDMVDDDDENNNNNGEGGPSTISSFVLTCSYVSVCMAKAIHGVENERQKFATLVAVDCRKRLEPPIPDTYFGNCVWGLFVETQLRDVTKKLGVILVAKSIQKKLKTLNDKGVFDGADDKGSAEAMAKERVEMIGVAGSNRFGVYGIDFGFGKPKKVEIASIDRGLTIGLAENKDVEKGGVEIGIVLNRNMMDLFRNLFHAGLSEQD